MCFCECSTRRLASSLGVTSYLCPVQTDIVSLWYVYEGKAVYCFRQL